MSLGYDFYASAVLLLPYMTKEQMYKRAVREGGFGRYKIKKQGEFWVVSGYHRLELFCHKFDHWATARSYAYDKHKADNEFK